MILGDIARVLPGIPFRSRIESDPDGGVVVIQARDLEFEGQVRAGGAARIRKLPVTPKSWLQTGDVIVQPRGSSYAAAEFAGSECDAVAAAPLLVLRTDPRAVHSPFLVAFLRSPATQALLRQAAVGTHVPQVPRQDIEALPIVLPSLADQIALAALAELERREREVMGRVRAARSRLFDLAIKQVAHRASPQHSR
ncbi:MAG: hypothetical protein K2Y40_13125 [Reyranella sp.]|nr:hypothetical protein [Reyranella sp.]